MHKTFALAALAALSLTGCAAGSMRTPVNGFLFNDTVAPEASAGSMESAKTGRACATSILGLVGTGDASIKKAAENGGITQVSYVDAEIKNYLSVYAQYCTVVHGS